MARSSPFDELERLLDRLDEARERTDGLAVDVKDADGEYEVTADLPGFENGDVDVEVQDRTVRIDADHEAESEASDEQYVRQERSRRSYSRSVTLPEDVVEDETTATLQHGVLTVTLPKSRGAGESTSIDVE